ncbi:VOC family protein [Janthinobacterium tructae]|uniref:VOC family protein n=1 Tax=Janthinobacterium tructae TaxID=2590869 RepID=UPI00249A1F82|nr:VOC family protein [Janthinobacterium tructae]MDI3295433.1 VOC family protein [Janthinobacterium tructae]
MSGQIIANRPNAGDYEERDSMDTFEIGGFREAVVIVTQIEPHLAAWLEVGGWELRHQGAVDAAILAAWGCPGVEAQEWLVAHPQCDTGLVRLVRLADAGERPQIRSDDQCWDTGGIFDLNVRVLAVDEKAAALRRQGWHGASPPIQWDFGMVNVKEWLAKGPDNLRLAVIERVAPPLQGFEHLRDFSQVFNSSQIVCDMERALAFYCGVLGFQNTYQYQAAAFPAGANVFGLPAEAAAQAGLHINIVHPQGKMEGSIELVTLPGAQGLDLSTDARPPNTGMAVLRFPVHGMAAFERHLRHAGVTPAFTRRRAQLAPHGEVELLGLRAPDGAWLEFYGAK